LPFVILQGSLVLYHFLIANAIHYILVYTWDSEHVAGMPANLIRSASTGPATYIKAQVKKCHLPSTSTLTFPYMFLTRHLDYCRPVERLLWGVVNVAWVFPIFFLAKVINATYFQEVADAAFRFLRGTAQPVAPRRE
jgi:hypothetical protein